MLGKDLQRGAMTGFYASGMKFRYQESVFILAIGKMPGLRAKNGFRVGKEELSGVGMVIRSLSSTGKMMVKRLLVILVLLFAIRHTISEKG